MTSKEISRLSYLFLAISLLSGFIEAYIQYFDCNPSNVMRVTNLIIMMSFLVIAIMNSMVAWTERKYEISLERNLTEQTSEDSRNYVKEIVDFLKYHEGNDFNVGEYEKIAYGAYHIYNIRQMGENSFSFAYHTGKKVIRLQHNKLNKQQLAEIADKIALIQ